MEYEHYQRMAGSYAIRSAFFINGKEIVFGIDDKEKEPYLVAHCKYDNPFGVPEYYNCVAFDDYAEAMELLGRRISQEAEMSMETTIRRGVSNTLTAEDCIPGSRSGDFQGELIVIRPDCLQRDRRTADYQLCRAVDGFGCKANAHGQAVYVKTVFDGRSLRYDRSDVLGVIRPDRIPGWANERLEQGKDQLKPKTPRKKHRSYER